MLDPRTDGRRNSADAGVVVMWKLTCPVALVDGGGVQVEAVMVDGSVQANVTVPVKPLFMVSVMVGSRVDPCVTWKLGTVGARVNSAGKVASQATASLSASTEPRPVTRL